MGRTLGVSGKNTVAAEGWGEGYGEKRGPPSTENLPLDLKSFKKKWGTGTTLRKNKRQASRRTAVLRRKKRGWATPATARRKLSWKGITKSSILKKKQKGPERREEKDLVPRSKRKGAGGGNSLSVWCLSKKNAVLRLEKEANTTHNVTGTDD